MKIWTFFRRDIKENVSGFFSEHSVVSKLCKYSPEKLPALPGSEPGSGAVTRVAIILKLWHMSRKQESQGDAHWVSFAKIFLRRENYAKIRIGEQARRDGVRRVSYLGL